jgi:hypothetical protein
MALRGRGGKPRPYPWNDWRRSFLSAEPGREAPCASAGRAALKR